MLRAPLVRLAAPAVLVACLLILPNAAARPLPTYAERAQLRTPSQAPLLQTLRQQLATHERGALQQQTAKGVTQALTPADGIPGQAGVTFAPGVDAATAARELAAVGSTILSTVPDLNVYRVATPPGLPPQQAGDRLRALAGVLRVEPIVRFRPDFTPNDPLYAADQPYLLQIHAEQAWDIQQGDPHIIVAVEDSGVDLQHPDLAGKIWTNPTPGDSGCGNDVHGCNFVDPASVDASCDPPDPAPAPNPDVSPNYWHGTFVSGVIGAATNNGAGIAGVAPNATIMPVKIGDCVGPLDTALASGILYAAQNGAQIINLSVGIEGCKQSPSDVLDAIAQAQQMGVLVIVASGSSGTACVGSPANSAGALAVGAVAADGTTRARFSQWGPQIAVVGPGASIIGPVPPGTQGGFPPPDGLYSISSGTSFSAPMVAGLADLLLSQNPLLTPLLLRRLIQRGATPLPDNNQPGWAGAGRMDMLASLLLVPAGFYGRLTGAGTSLANGTPVVARISNQVCGQGVTTTAGGLPAYSIFVQPDLAQPGCGTRGAQVRFTIGGRDAGTGAWNATAVPLDLTVQTAQAANSTASLQLRAGWNLIAGNAGAAAARAALQIYTFQPGDNGYEALSAGTPAEAAAGYWAYVATDTAIPAPSNQAQRTSVRAPAGHYVMVGNSDTSRAVSVVGADSVLVYDPVSGRYTETTTLQPEQGAWVYSSGGATVILQ